MGNTRPRLLVVSPTFPYPLVSGGKTRIYHILKHLSQNFRVTLLSLAEPGDDTDENKAHLAFLDRVIAVPIDHNRIAQLFRLLTNSHRWLAGIPAEVLVKRSTRMRMELDRLLSLDSFAAVQIEYTQGMQYLPAVNSSLIPSLVVAHDISHIAQERKAAVYRGLHHVFWAGEAKRMKSYERRQWGKIRRIVVMSEIDRGHVLKLIPDAKLDVVPNGVDVKKFRVHSEDTTPKIVFVGWMRHLPNSKALSWFLDEIWPLIRNNHSGVRFEVIGRALPKKLHQKILRDDYVDYLGYVNDIESHVGKAWVSVVPIQIASGSRLKILESMALGTPVVSTAVGCEGISVRSGREILIADKAEKFAKAVLQLLNNKSARMRLSSNARVLVEENYDWQKIGSLASNAVMKTISCG